ncbi:hypothetical protein BKA93DRAFT_753407 [Sparassis latifolia]
MDPFLELAALLPAGLTPPLVDDGFFDYPQNQTQYKELAERICRQVEASHEYSKNARPYPLKIVERWCPSSFAWNNISFASRLYRHRALPEMMHCTAFYEAFADIMIILTNPLWIGTADHTPEAMVVMKIFLESAFLPPERFDEARAPHSWMKWYTGAAMARSEAGDYECMSALQEFWKRLSEQERRYPASGPSDGSRCNSPTVKSLLPMSWSSSPVGLPRRGLANDGRMVVVPIQNHKTWRDSARHQRSAPATSSSAGLAPQPVVFTEFVFGRNSDAKSVASNITNFGDPDGGHQGTAGEDRACKGAPFTQLFALYSTQFPQWFQAF